MSIKNKISNFFIPIPTAKKNMPVVEDFFPEEVLTTSSGFAEINRELWHLMDLGEFEKVAELSRKYNYFNQYPSLGLYAIEAGNFALLKEVIRDLIVGPLFPHFSDFLNAGQIPELFFLNRTLYLADYADSQWGHSAPSHAGTKAVLQVFRRNSDFDVFIERFHEQLANVEADQRQDYVADKLTRHLSLNVEKMHAALDLRNKPLAIPDGAISQFQLAELCLENNMAQLIEYCSGEAMRPHNQAVLEIARKNIHNYLRDGQPAHYPQSQAKMDIIELSKVISLEGLHSLVRKFNLLDFYPILAYRYLQTHDYQQAMSLILDFAEQAKIFELHNEFEHELLKDQILSLIHHVSLHLNKLEHDLCRSFLREVMNPVYLKKLQVLYGAQLGAFNHEEYKRLAVEPLISTSKIIFIKK